MWRCEEEKTIDMHIHVINEEACVQQILFSLPGGNGDTIGYLFTENVCI